VTGGLGVPDGLAAGAADGPFHLLWLSGGGEDPRLGQVRRFGETLSRAGLAHQWRVREGAHDWRLWRRDLRDFVARLFVER
jgi:enterochelin esterase-like enzyme